MNTIAWLLIISAALMIRAVSKGRSAELPQDLRDMLLGALTGDFDAVKEAAGRTGEGLTPAAVVSVAPLGEAAVTGAMAGAAVGTASAKAAALVTEVKRLGTGKPYVWGGTFAAGRGGDCSGLVWRAVKNLGIYSGGRFTTFTFPVASRSFAVRVASPAPGDIVVWHRGATGHMGVVTGGGRFFSALSRRSGVKEAAMKNITGRVEYYRLK